MIRRTDTIQLVLLAAGLGSRFGGLKQMAPMGLSGEWLLEFALFDAYKAGMRRLVFIVQHEMVPVLEEELLTGLRPFFEVRLAIQERENIPDSLGALGALGALKAPNHLPRKKPWGTAHALWCAKDVIDSDFIVMNADDYYGPSCFENLLASPLTPDGLLGFSLKNTLSEHGGVSRGLLTVSSKAELLRVEERHGLRRAELSEDEKNQWVSMNMWFLKKEWPSRIEEFLHEKLSTLSEAPEHFQSLECYLLEAINVLANRHNLKLTVVTTHDQWLGVTYKEDQHLVKQTLTQLQRTGDYPTPLWPKEGN